MSLDTVTKGINDGDACPVAVELLRKLQAAAERIPTNEPEATPNDRLSGFSLDPSTCIVPGHDDWEDILSIPLDSHSSSCAIQYESSDVVGSELEPEADEYEFEDNANFPTMKKTSTMHKVHHHHPLLCHLPSQHMSPRLSIPSHLLAVNPPRNRIPSLWLRNVRILNWTLLWTLDHVAYERSEHSTCMLAYVALVFPRSRF